MSVLNDIVIRPTVFPSGPITGKDAQNYWENIRDGLDASVELIMRGYSPFPDFPDFAFGLRATVTVKEYHEMDIAWLVRADALLMLEGWEESTGATKERAVALALGIPVFYSMEDLNDWVETWKPPTIKELMRKGTE